MSNAIRCIDQRFAFKNSGISCLTLIFKLKNPSTTVLYAKNQLQVAKYDESYTVFFELYLRLVAVLQRVGRRGFDSWRWLKPFATPRPFCVALSPSVHWHSRFYIAALSIIFLFGFRQCRSRDDRVVNLNMTIRLALFWRTWTRARARTRPHVLAWHMGRDYSDCRASELTDRQVSGFVFSWFLENTEKRKAL